MRNSARLFMSTALCLVLWTSTGVSVPETAKDTPSLRKVTNTLQSVAEAIQKAPMQVNAQTLSVLRSAGETSAQSSLVAAGRRPPLTQTSNTAALPHGTETRSQSLRNIVSKYLPESWRHKKPPMYRVQRIPASSSQHVAAATFAELVDRVGINKLKAASGLSTRGLFARAKASRKLPRPSNLKGIAVKGASGIMVVAALGFYIDSMIDVFNRTSTALEKAAVATSIVTMVGCTVRAVDNQVKGTPDILDTSLCLMGDMLLFTPLWALGIAIHIGRFLIPIIESIIDFRQRTTPEALQRARLQGWKEFTDRAEQYLSSSEFEDQLELQLQGELVGIMYEASEERGLIDEGIAERREAATTLQMLIAINALEADALERLTSDLCHNVTATRDRLGNDLLQSATQWVRFASYQYDEDFFLNLKEEAKWKSLDSPRRLYHAMGQVWREHDLMASAAQVFSILDRKLRSVFWVHQECAFRHLEMLQPKPQETLIQAMTPNPQCLDPCPASGEHQGTVGFEKITHEGTGIFACQDRNSNTLTSFESEPLCCPFEELTLQLIAIRSVEVSLVRPMHVTGAHED
ncbi:hypothetical protein CDD81_5122 [Ophiocordyceps australis]|uniref:Uncharacterized protein n=1 Tax=Ophiocordyceps australis TaxID=1399860 RepID=A0A2C5Y5P5_9HYPO|nr:hypothetical protein CDD81_5122 [Ophiocordyceps australis]